MFKRVLATVVALALTLPAFADVKISAEPSMSALGGTEIFLGNQSGVTKTATAAQFGTYVLTVANTVFSFNAGTSFSGASWSTVSPTFNAAASTMNDTTASGTVAIEAGYTIQAANFTSTGGASTTITNPATLWVGVATCSGGVVCTTPNSIYTAGRIFAGGTLNTNSGVNLTGTLNLNVNSNNIANINSGTSNGALHLADGTGNNAVGLGNGTGTVTLGSQVKWGGTTFTVSGGTGACATSSTLVGGVAAGKFTCTGSTGASAIKVVVPAATSDVACWSYDFTHYVVATVTVQSTTGCTFSYTSVTTSDVIYFGVMEF